MASAAPEYTVDPLVVREASWVTERYQFGPQGGRELDFGTAEEPIILIAPVGVSELLIQERRCGDVYAEISGPKLCKSSIGTDALDAAKNAFAQVRS